MKLGRLDLWIHPSRWFLGGFWQWRTQDNIPVGNWRWGLAFGPFWICWRISPKLLTSGIRPARFRP